MYKESLIVEQIVAKVGLDPCGVDSSPGSEFDRIAAALRIICAVGHGWSRT